MSDDDFTVKDGVKVGPYIGVIEPVPYKRRALPALTKIEDGQNVSGVRRMGRKRKKLGEPPAVTRVSRDQDVEIDDNELRKEFFSTQNRIRKYVLRRGRAALRGSWRGKIGKCRVEKNGMSVSMVAFLDGFLCSRFGFGGEVCPYDVRRLRAIWFMGNRWESNVDEISSDFGAKAVSILLKHEKDWQEFFNGLIHEVHDDPTAAVKIQKRRNKTQVLMLKGMRKAMEEIGAPFIEDGVEFYRAPRGKRIDDENS